MSDYTWYAVGVESKRHVIYRQQRDPLDGENWMLKQGDPDGWISWHGGECPLPIHAAHKIKMRSGEVSQLDDEADSWCWDHQGGEGDIIAYRPILDTKPCRFHDDDAEACETYSGQVPCEPEPHAWNGEGLPPVGCEVETSRDSQLYEGFMEGDKVEVLAHKRAKAAEVAVVWSDTAGKSAQFIAEMFRPIRSEEDRAVDEMKDIINDKVGGFSETTLSAIASTLYRYGYRKHDD